SSDAAICAAPAIRAGYPESLAYYLGKVLECASFNAEPYAGKETVIGEISHEDVKVTAMSPYQRCTPASVAGHAMYERSNPYYEYFAGGMLAMSGCRYEQYDEKTTRVTGPRFVPAEQLTVKLEGAGKVGERYMGFAGVRDPYTIARIDEVIAWARRQVEERFGPPEEGGYELHYQVHGRDGGLGALEPHRDTRAHGPGARRQVEERFGPPEEGGYELHYQVYGRDGVMGALEPNRDKPAHELGILVFGVAPTAEMAEEVALTGTRQMFYARLPDVKGTAGGVAFPLDEVVRVSPAYRWTLNHALRVDDPLELFELHTTEVAAAPE